MTKEEKKEVEELIKKHEWSWRREVAETSAIMTGALLSFAAARAIIAIVRRLA